MENGICFLDLQEQYLDIDYFKPEYENQEVKNSLNFKNGIKQWKKKKERNSK